MAARRHAPAFQITAGPDRALCLASALIGAAAGLALAAGWVSHSANDLGLWPLLGAALSLSFLLAGLGWKLHRHAPLSLRWDGQAWWLRPRERVDEQPVHVQVVMDFGGWMLLRLRPPGLVAALWPRYLALSRRELAAQWPQLRATLYTAHVDAEPVA